MGGIRAPLAIGIRCHSWSDGFELHTNISYKAGPSRWEYREWRSSLSMGWSWRRSLFPSAGPMPPMAGFSSSCRSCGAWRSTVFDRTIEIWPEPSSSSWESPSWSSVREDDPGVRPVFHQVIPDASPSLCLRPGRSSLQEAGSSVNAGNKVS